MENNLDWPILPYKKDDIPHFLFIITLPFSGSTALSQLINSSKKTMILHNKGEGQWLIPGLCDNNRWDSNKEVNYESVKSIWLNKYQEHNKINKNIEVVIEKSPPNMMRIMNLMKVFKNHSFLANNRNPYAQCASMLYRNYNPQQLSKILREDIIKNLALKWVARSKVLKSLIIDLDIPLLTYEEFCKKPKSIKEVLTIPKDAISTIQVDAIVKVKDYKPQKIINQNNRQIKNLTKNDIDVISQVLSKNIDLLKFFNYRIYY